MFYLFVFFDVGLLAREDGRRPTDRKDGSILESCRNSCAAGPFLKTESLFPYSRIYDSADSVRMRSSFSPTSTC